MPLYDKYEVRKKWGITDPNAEYFVLRVDKDPYAREAILAYATACEVTDPELAKELRAWVRKSGQESSLLAFGLACLEGKIDEIA